MIWRAILFCFFYTFLKLSQSLIFIYLLFYYYYCLFFVEEAAGICRSAFLHTDVSRLRGTSGTFFSPDYPVPFPTNRTCTWTITVPAGKIVKLTFENFTIAVERDLWYCTEEWKDYVEIRDGLTSNGKELARYSCSWRATPDVPDVYSSGRYMWVNFHSGPRESVFKRNDKNKGFKAHFEAVDPSGKHVCSCLLPYLVVSYIAPSDSRKRNKQTNKEQQTERLVAG